MYVWNRGTHLPQGREQSLQFRGSRHGHFDSIHFLLKQFIAAMCQIAWVEFAFAWEGVVKGGFEDPSKPPFPKGLRHHSYTLGLRPSRFPSLRSPIPSLSDFSRSRDTNRAISRHSVVSCGCHDAGPIPESIASISATAPRSYDC